MTPETASWISTVVVALLVLAWLACRPFVWFDRWGGARRLRVVVASRVLRRRIPRRLDDMPGHPDRMPSPDDPADGAYWDLIGRFHEDATPVGGDA